MSSGREIEDWQYSVGLGHKPEHVTRAEQEKALSGEEFAKHAKDVFSTLGGNFAEARVTATAQAVVADWRAEGREVAPDRDTAEELAFAVNNRLHGFGGGRGLGAMFGRVFPDAEEAEEAAGAGADAAAWRRKAGLE